MLKILKSFILVIVSSFLLTACASKKDNIVGSDTELLETGNAKLEQGEYAEAIAQYEAIERDHPASDLVVTSMVNRAFALYAGGKFIDSIHTIEQFVALYPTYPDLDYVLYLKGLNYFDQIMDVGRDQSLTEDALLAFETLMMKFPESKYSKEAKFKADFCLNNLAGKEMEIAFYYLRQGNQIAAINRYQTIINSRLQSTIFTPEALYRLSVIYMSMGAIEEARKYASVLGHNYPESRWYAKAYALMFDEKSHKPRKWYKELKEQVF